MVLANAVMRLAQRDDGRKLLMRFGNIHIGSGNKPSARVDHEVLEIRVTPAMGRAGRPSSDFIARALRDH